MKKTLAVFLAAAMLTACAETPENILKKENIKESTAQNGDENISDEPKYIPVSELASAGELVPLITGQSYDNLTFGENFDLYTGEKTAVYEVIFMDDFDKNAELLFGHYIPEDDFDKSLMEYHEGFPQSSSWSYETDDVLSVVSSVGGFALSDGECRDIYSGSGFDYISTYCFDSADPSETVMIGGEEATLAELKQNAEDFITEFTERTDYPNEIRPLSVTTQTLEDGRVAAHIHCRSVFEGLPVFDTMSLHSEYSFDIPDIIGPTFTVAEGSRLGKFMVTSAYMEYKTEQELSEIISPAWAVGAASEKLSGFSEYEVQRAELVYMPECIGNTDGIEPNHGYNSGDIIRLTPYWVIYFDMNWWQETFAAVNAVTGEIDFINNAK